MKNRSALAILFIIVFIDLLGFGMVVPVMSQYAAEMGAPKKYVGLLMAGYSAMQFVFAPIWGRLSDRVGRRPMLLASIAMTAVAFAAYALAPTFGWLLASRFFAGAATANIGIAQAYIADVTPPEGRAKGMGIIGAAFGLGFVFGPFIGGVLSTYVSMSAPGWAAAILAAANGVAAFFVLPEPAERVAAPRRPRFATLAEDLRKPGVRRLAIVYLLSLLAFSAMEATFSLLANDAFALDRRSTNYVFAYIGVIIVAVQGGLIGPLTRRFGEKRLLVAGLAMQVVGLAGLPFARGAWAMLAVLVPLAVGSGLSSPALSSLLSKAARADDLGGTLGIGQSAAALGRVLGPEAGTWTYDRYSPAFPYVGGAVLMALAALVSVLVRPPSGAQARIAVAEE